jgi:hypothetical protein
MYTKNKCKLCGYVMVGEISNDFRILYFCPKPGHTDRDNALIKDLSDYQEIADSLII